MAYARPPLGSRLAAIAMRAISALPRQPLRYRVYTMLYDAAALFSELFNGHFISFDFEGCYFEG